MEVLGNAQLNDKTINDVFTIKGKIHICTFMFIAALLTISKRWKPPMFPLTNE